MAQNTQRTIKLYYVEIINKKSLLTVYSEKIFEDSEDGAAKVGLANYLTDLPDDVKKKEKSAVFARVADVKTFKATCKMTDFIQICIDKGTVEKIED